MKRSAPSEPAIAGRRARFDRWELDTEALAQALLGQVLVRIEGGRRRSGRIVETEAYLGGDDLGSHSAGGRRTPRNESMFLGGGHAYVYFVYGMHHCFNVVAAPAGIGCAVLIRAIEPLEGARRMATARGMSAAPATRVHERLIGGGPARLCQAMAIDRALDGENLRSSSRIFIERGDRIEIGRMMRGPRIGIAYAGAWSGAPLRFALRGSACISRPFGAITADSSRARHP